MDQKCRLQFRPQHMGSRANAVRVNDCYLSYPLIRRQAAMSELQKYITALYKVFKVLK